MKLTPLQQFNIARLLLVAGIIFIAFTLFSCGSRKVNKSISKTESQTKEHTDTRTQEDITETVTTTIDTTVTTPKRTSNYTSVLVDSSPMVFEDDNIRSETSYDRKTGFLSNKVTVKPTKIYVKEKSVTERQIKRNTDIKSDKVVESKTESKGKQVEREGSSWLKLVIRIAIFGALTYIGWLIFGNRKKKEDESV